MGRGGSLFFPRSINSDCNVIAAGASPSPSGASRCTITPLRPKPGAEDAFRTAATHRLLHWCCRSSTPSALHVVLLRRIRVRRARRDGGGEGLPFKPPNCAYTLEQADEEENVGCPRGNAGQGERKKKKRVTKHPFCAPLSTPPNQTKNKPLLARQNLPPPLGDSGRQGQAEHVPLILPSQE